MLMSDYGVEGRESGMMTWASKPFYNSSLHILTPHAFLSILDTLFSNLRHARLRRIRLTVRNFDRSNHALVLFYNDSLYVKHYEES